MALAEFHVWVFSNSPEGDGGYGHVLGAVLVNDLADVDIQQGLVDTSNGRVKGHLEHPETIC